MRSKAISSPTFFMNRNDLEKFQNSIDQVSQSTLDSSEFQKSVHKNVLLTDSLEPQSLIELALQKKECHIIQNSIQPIHEKVEFINRLQLNPNQYYSENFSLLNRPQNSATSLDVHFKQQDDRSALIESVFLHFKLNSSYNRHRIFFQIINELIMNIQINAPHQSKQLNTRDSLLKIELAEGYVGVSAIDFYGALSVDHLLNRILTVQKDGFADSIQMNQSQGAGIGSTMIYNNCDSFFVGCQPQQSTRISVVFPFNINENQTEFMQKSIHKIG